MLKVEGKTFDFVHDTQDIYRKLLDCMARPGKINCIKDSLIGIEEISGISQSLVALAYTLVDREVTFHVKAENRQTVEKHISRRTYSKSSQGNDAQYLFIEKYLSNEDIQKVMGEVQFGTLEDPHLSTTIILVIDSLSATPEYEQKLELKGPGIQTSRTLYLNGLSPQWLIDRKIVNAEFPLGVDMILVSKSGSVAALPRTTIIESECV